MEIKKCFKCNVEKSTSEFSGNYSYCKECATKNSKEWYYKNKEHVKDRLCDYHKTKKREILSVINPIKENLGCKICGERNSCCLDFHHVNSKDKKTNVSRQISNKSIDKIFKEISKCVCVCSNCHRKIHAGVLESPTEVIEEDWIRNECSKFLSFEKTRWKYSERRENCKQGFKKNIKEEKELECKECKNKFLSKDYDRIYCSSECSQINKRKVRNRPDKETLKNLINTMPWTRIGNKYGVSDNTVRKWAKNEGLL